MALRTTVKVGKISNLSDARYCSGMGVQLMGFSVLPGSAHYIEPSAYQEIRGWFSGPAVVAELEGIGAGMDIARIISDYAPDFLEVNVSELGLLEGNEGLPVIVRGTAKQVKAGESPLAQLDRRLQYIILQGDDEDEAIMLSKRYPILIAPVNGDDPLTWLHRTEARGLALDGSPEERPGFKEYGSLAETLERLTVD